MRGRIVEVYKEEGANRIGLVEFDGKRRAIYLSLVPAAQAGDEVLFHAGFATELVPGSEPASPTKPSALPRTAEIPRMTIDDGAYRVLSDLDPPQLRKIIPLAEERQYAAGDIIFPAGATSRSLHLIVSGDVALEAVTGRDTDEVQTLHAGDCMGWSAISGRALTHFQARALSPVGTIAIPGERLRAACDSDPALGYALMKQLVELASERLDAMRLKLSHRRAPALAAG